MTNPDQVTVDFLCRAQKGDAIHLGHHQIGEHKVELLPTQRFQRLVGRSKTSSRVALVLQRIAKGRHLSCFIIQNEQFGDCRNVHRVLRYSDYSG